MTYDLNQIAPEFALLAPNDVVITPNRRISAWLHRQVDAAKIKQSTRTSVWSSSTILPLSTWIDSLLEEARDSVATSVDGGDEELFKRLQKLVLSTSQEKTVWEAIIKRHGGDWIKPDGAAKQAQQAWSILNRWGEISNIEAGDVNDNTHLFQQWLVTFKAECDDNGWITKAEIPKLVEQCVEEGLVSIANQLFFYGFDDLEPGIKQVVNAFILQGSEYRHLAFKENPNQSMCLGYPDKNKELSAALTWLVTSNISNPAGSFCVVAPDIADDRSLIERLCKQLVQSQTFTHPNDNGWRDFINVSAGTPLGSYGIVADALLLLNVITKPLSREEWGVLLRSPYWGDSASTTRFARMSQLTDKLAEAKKEKLSIEFVRQISSFRHTSLDEKSQQSQDSQLDSENGVENGVEEVAEKVAEKVADSLTTLLDGISSQNVEGKKRFSDWAIIIPELLESLGWPGQRSLSSQDYQLREKFFEQVSALSLFDEVIGVSVFSDAVRKLYSALNETMFQIKTEQAPMQVLGVLEASGLYFDGVWVLSADDQHWPASPAPNPFISPHLQRSAGMPNASAEKELAYAQFILSAFPKTSSQTVFSWHEFEGDNELNASPILENIQTPENWTGIDLAAGKGTTDPFMPTVFGEKAEDRMEDLHDDVGSPLPEGVSVKGGASIVKTQALCPFKAFAEYRLRAKPAEQAEEGLSPAERGELVHKSLELFWKECGSSQRLLVLLENEALLIEMISGYVHEAMNAFNDVHKGVNEAFLSLEKNRLEALVLSWLKDIESRRTPFSVSSVEKTESLSISNLDISVKADRIDLIDDSYTVIIDYKTGQKSRASWEGERPDDPQLPLYAVSHRDTVDGIVFGIVKKGESSIKGEVDEMVSVFDGKNSTSIARIGDWPSHLTNWQSVLTTLATDFCQGFAAVDPKSKTSCQYCELTPFCRRKEG